MKPGDELLFLALGGSGEIGMNANLYGCRGKWLMVDCGVTFADPAYPGIDVILPDLGFIEERADDLLGIVITHGHEDHIGALPYLAADLDVPIYATKFTAGLIRSKLEEEGVAEEIDLHVVDDGGNVDLGPFQVRFVPLAHSIPEGNGLLIGTPFGNVFHSGDWKIDETPVLGSPSTAAELGKIGDEGVLALMCDSTNVFNETPSGSEASVREGLLDVVTAARGRVMVTTFASNAARLHTLGEVAKASGRTLCVAGRSLDRIIANAKASGYLTDFPKLVDWDAIMDVPPAQAMIIATGGQGEPRAALARIASDNHPIKLDAGDTVIFSSKQIPGNEVAIGRIQNQLAEKGVIMVTDRQAAIHVSGHPARPELAAMYGWLRPEILIPVHGEMRHLAEHARFARAQGVPNALVQQNGALVRLAPGTPGIIGHEPVGMLVVDGDVILPSDGATMTERRKISINGQISVAVALDALGHKLGDPQFRIQGVPVEEDREAFLKDAAEAVEHALEGKRGDIETLREKLRLAVRRTATRWTGKKPVVDVLIIESKARAA